MELNKVSPPPFGRARESNIELYRILVMLLIVAHHYVVNSKLGLVVSDNVFSFRSIFYLLFGCWGKIGINCFVCITAWFMCKSHITLEKFTKLLLQVYFYRFIFFIVFLLTGFEKCSIRSLFWLLSPFGSGIYSNFTGCFLLFFLCIPFLNVLLQHLTRQKHFQLVCLMLCVYSALPLIPWFHVIFNYTTWFCILYIIVSYLRFYPNRLTDNSLHYGWLLLVCLAFAIGSVVCIVLFNQEIGKHVAPFFFVSDSNKILAVIIGLLSFFFFKNLPIRHSQIINTISATTFGVLCIHANSDAMREFLWNRLFRNADFYSSPYFIMHAFGTVLTVFAVCSFIDYLRLRFLEPSLMRLALPVARKIKSTVFVA